MVRYSDSLSLTFVALADPTRRDALERMANGSASVSELAAPHGMTVPGMMKHLAVLESAGLVHAEKDGRVRRCDLTAAPMREASAYLARYRRLWDRRLARLDALVTEQHATSREGSM
jgi:DNA-binding transcriptional ArsR family regulator